MGNDKLKAFSVQIAAVVSAGYEFFVKKTGLFALLLKLSGPAKDLMATNFEEMWKEILDLDDTERLDVEAAFKSALAPELMSSVGTGVGIFERAVQLVGRLVKNYHDALSVVSDFKALFGI